MFLADLQRRPRCCQSRSYLANAKSDAREKPLLAS